VLGFWMLPRVGAVPRISTCVCRRTHSCYAEGTGSLLKALSQSYDVGDAGLQLFGVDFCAEMINMATKKLPQLYVRERQRRGGERESVCVRKCTQVYTGVYVRVYVCKPMCVCSCVYVCIQVRIPLIAFSFVLSTPRMPPRLLPAFWCRSLL
jgi:hypothetical protein